MRNLSKQIFSKFPRNYRDFPCSSPLFTRILFRWVNDLMLIICVLMTALLLTHPQEAILSARSAIQVWGMDVIPSLFPYMVLCRVLTSQLKRAPVSAPVVISLLGLSGGSPSGAATLRAFADSGSIQNNQVLPLFALTGTISPMFLLNTLSLWFRDSVFGIRLLIANLMGSILTAITVSFFQGDTEDFTKCMHYPDSSVDDPIIQSVHSVLNVGGAIVFYSILASYIRVVMPNASPLFCAVIHSLLEISGGMREMASLPISQPLCAGLTGFGGISVLSQNYYFLKHYLPAKALVTVSVIRAFFSTSIMQLLVLFG